jgi:polyphosphate kinase
LISAAKNGKKVIVVLELQARFDEKANLEWANVFKDEGVEVHFGVEGIKIHSKLLLITREEKDVDEKYAVLSTGNFNESTAKLYTDHAMMTSKKGIVDEVEQVFEIIQRPYLRRTFRNLWVSPFTMRSKIIKHIQNEIKSAQAGKVAWIKLKLNNVADKEITDELYKASQAGVEIRLIIRGMCSIVPELKGVSENLKAISLVDRFLEHSRVYMFANAGRTICMLSSADWMTRNLDYRVEVAFPVRDPKLRKEVETVLDMQWKDNVKARKVDASGSNKIVKNDEEPFRSQEKIYDYIAGIEKRRRSI